MFFIFQMLKMKESLKSVKEGKMKSCLIISGGEYSAIDEKVVAKCEFVIACDKGIEYAQQMNIKVDLALGDFDSFLGNYEKIELDEKIHVMRLPAEKDYTDTFVAITEAIKRGFKDIVIACALGRRLDHGLANMQSAVYAVKNGARVEMISCDEHLYFFSNGTVTLERREGFSLSVFSLSDKCEGIFERGTKYTLENAMLENSFPIGVSNEWAEDVAEISAGKGVILVVESRLR